MIVIYNVLLIYLW